MPYVLSAPVEAIQYRRGDNERAVVALVHREGVSFSNTRGELHIYNGGVELHIDDGNWLVAMSEHPVVMTDELFRAHFVEAT